VSVSLPEPPQPEEAVSCWSGWMLCMTPTPVPAAPPPTKKTAATPLLGEWGGRVVDAPATSSKQRTISFQPMSGVADDEGMEYKPNAPLAGIIDDFRRRAAHYRSDWTDGLRNQRTLSAGLFMFFATFSSTVALGHVVSKKTDGAFGVCEYLLMNSFAGIFYSIVGCQPYVVLRPTGPITMLLTKLYAIAGAFGFEYFSFVATTGLWVGIYMAAISAFELCRYTRLLTRFTHDIFAFFVCSIYILDGVRGIFDRFADYKSAADPGNALLAMVMAIAIVLIAIALGFANSSIFCVSRARSLAGQYALAIAIAIVALLAHTLFSPTFDVEYVSLPGLKPTTVSRSWWVGLSGDGRQWFVGAGAAAMIVIFFFIDQNISSALCQKREMNLKKGSYYHSSFLLLGFFNVVGPLFGLPFVTGSLPHSPQFVVAATSPVFEDKVSGRVRSNTVMPTKSGDAGPQIKGPVLETRFAPLLCYTLIGLALLVPSVVTFMPTAAVDGTLAFVGLEGLVRTQLFERVLLLFSEPALFPETRYTSEVNIGRMHLYTLIQLACWGICWVINNLLGIVFPLWVAALIPIRLLLLPRIFTQEELAGLDGGDL